uniref:uncharacterized protein LOC120346361 n=1 Tax=Styela clava TaxID=7725 RepID=UPI0019395BB2|nr:uncharacterized protein LOC120346361 [Styela clava]
MTLCCTLLFVLLATSFFSEEVDARSFPTFCSDIYNTLPSPMWRQLCGHGNPGPFIPRTAMKRDEEKEVSRALLEELAELQSDGEVEKRDGFFAPSDDYLNNMMRWLKLNSYNRRY